MAITYNEKIKCRDCRFARVDENAGDRDWTAYECGNPESEYHKALINVTPNGERMKNISWQGCEAGRAKI